MSTLHIRLPSKAASHHAPQAVACAFSLVSHGGTIEREGTLPLSALSGMMADAQRVVALLAASDVSLVHVKVPPLSPAKLKAALPHLVEDKIIADPADCVVVAGGSADGLRTVAVVQRAWFDLVTRTLADLGARRVMLLPAQLCLPLQDDHPSAQPDRVTAAISEQGAEINITLRLSEQDGIGLTINAAEGETAIHEVVQTLCAMVPEAPVTLLVPQSAVHSYQDVVARMAGLNQRLSVVADNWSHWIAGAHNATLDLIVASGAETGRALNWRPWRWSFALLALIVLVNVLALNIDWWRMKSEAKTLRATMTQIYKSTYPNESVIIDPMVQMQQKIALAKRGSGQAAPDDFTAITAAFGEAWASAMQGQQGVISGLEYRERALQVRFKPDADMRRLEGGAAQIKTLLAVRNLSLESVAGQSATVVWQIRSAK